MANASRSVGYWLNAVRYVAAMIALLEVSLVHAVKRGSYDTMPKYLQYKVQKKPQKPLPPVDNVGFVVHPTNMKAARLFQKAAELVKSLGYGAYTPSKRTAEIGEIKRIEADQFVKQIQLNIAIGGDGTLLFSNMLQQEDVVPTIGINEGQVGHLTLFSSDSMGAAVLGAVKGEIPYEKRNRLDIRSTVFDGSLHAINEMVLQPTEGNMVVAEIYDNQNPMRVDRADKVMVSTDSGSTAYNHSANGPIVRVGTNAMVVNAVASLTSDRAIVVPGNHRISIRTPRSYARPVILADNIPVFVNKAKKLLGSGVYAYDGNISTAKGIGEWFRPTLTEEDWVVTKISKKPAIFLVPTEDYYYPNLEKKLHLTFDQRKK